MTRTLFAPTLALLCCFAPAQNAHEKPDAQPFAEGVISTGKEFTVTFSPDGSDVYFTRNDSEKKINHVMHSRKMNGVWQPAEKVNFSSDQWSDLDPSLSPDGKQLFFVSTRPAPGKDPAKKDMDIWVSKKAGSDWGPPQHLAAVNSDAKEGSPSVDREGNLYFFSDRNSQPNSNAIYVAPFRNGKYSAPEKLPAVINAGPSDTSPFISADGRTLLFYSTREGGYGQADVYVSFLEKGKWSNPQNLGPVVNTDAFEYNPSVSRDGRTLYFGRNRKILEVALAAVGIAQLDPKRFH